jgi:hypothetical protein
MIQPLSDLADDESVGAPTGLEPIKMQIRRRTPVRPSRSSCSARRRFG